MAPDRARVGLDHYTPGGLGLFKCSRLDCSYGLGPANTLQMISNLIQTDPIL
jgi:hypothetical protein